MRCETGGLRVRSQSHTQQGLPPLLYQTHVGLFHEWSAQNGDKALTSR